jgi:16S rRNA (guanine527-N7)-methyltransferase
MPDAFADTVSATLRPHLGGVPGLLEGGDTDQAGVLPALADELGRFCAALEAANRRINLTGIVDPEGMAVRHVLDALTALPALEGVGSVVDLGSGCGVPGIPLALARPELEVVLVESRERKAAALVELVDELGLAPRVTAVRARGEVWLADHPADVVVTRAVGSIAEQLRMLRKVRSCFRSLVMLKGPAADAELAELAGRLESLGFDYPSRHTAQLPNGAGTRVVLTFNPST